MRGFVLLKPEAVQRNLVGRLISAIEDKGLKIIALKMLQAELEQVRQLYGHLESRPYYQQMLSYAMDGPVIAMVVDAPGAIDASALLTQLQGTFKSSGTLRFRFVSHPSRNVLHCSENSDAAEREIASFVAPHEVCEYEKVLDRWLN